MTRACTILFSVLFFFGLAPQQLQAVTLTNTETSAPYTLGLNLGLEAFTFPVPGKLAPAVLVRFEEPWQVEAVYARGKAGVGYARVKALGIREEDVTLRGRRYLGRHFNVFLGLGRRRLAVETLPQLSRYYATQSATIERTFLESGIATEWQPYQNLTIGLEWFAIAVPVGKARIKEHGEFANQPLVDKAFHVAGMIPGARVLSLQVGWLFATKRSMPAPESDSTAPGDRPLDPANTEPNQNTETPEETPDLPSDEQSTL